MRWCLGNRATQVSPLPRCLGNRATQVSPLAKRRFPPGFRCEQKTLRHTPLRGLCDGMSRPRHTQMVQPVCWGRDTAGGGHMPEPQRREIEMLPALTPVARVVQA